MFSNLKKKKKKKLSYGYSGFSQQNRPFCYKPRNTNFPTHWVSLSVCYRAMTLVWINYLTEPRHDKTNKVTVRPAKAQISLGIRPVWSVFAVRMKTPWVLSYPLSAQRRLWSDWAHSQFVLSCRGSINELIKKRKSQQILMLNILGMLKEWRFLVTCWICNTHVPYVGPGDEDCPVVSHSAI